MKTKIITLAIHILLSVAFIQGQVTRTINVGTAGSLSTLVGSEKTTITNLTLTGTINDADFTTIKQMTALKDLNMSAVNISNGAIPAGAFQNKVMDRIILPTSLTTIGNKAFSGTTVPSLDFSTCPNLETIGIYAFENTKLTNNVIDLSKLSRVKFSYAMYGHEHAGTFTRCSAHVILPTNKTALETLSFSLFKGSVTLPPALEETGNRVFSNATLTQEIILPPTLKVIGDGAFEKAVLPRLTLPASLLTVGSSAFSGTTVPSLDFSTCPNIQTMGVYAFQNAQLTNNVIDLSKLSQVKFSYAMYGHEHAGTFTRCSAHVILPTNKTALETLSFSLFKGSVTLPPVLEEIGSRAFSNANLVKELVLPASLKVIRNGAFENATLPGLRFDKMGGQSGLTCF